MAKKPIPIKFSLSGKLLSGAPLQLLMYGGFHCYLERLQSTGLTSMNCAVIKVSHVLLQNKIKMLVVEGIPSLSSPSEGLFSTVYVSMGMSNATVADAQALHSRKEAGCCCGCGGG